MRHNSHWISVLTLLVLIGCDGNAGSHASTVSFVTDYAPISFSFPSSWKRNQEKHPYDLQTLSRSEDMNTGVYVFKDVDMASDFTPQDILKTQIDDLRSKRENFKEFEPIRKSTLADKVVTTATYTGTKNNERMCYHFSLIEFREDKSKIAVTLQVAWPEDWDEAKPLFERIVKSATSLPNSN
jgi:hypothetical protein